jgi:hypothetical protein
MDRDHPDLIAPTRDLLEWRGLPWVIENVPGREAIPPAMTEYVGRAMLQTNLGLAA